MAVDTSVDVAMVRMNRDGKLFGSGVMRDLKEGRNFRLYAVQAGTYNTRRLVPEVLVNGDEFHVIRPRPTYEDLIALDSVPDWLA